jgi:ubiquinone/menaquinone biosynthesis C-methylase UbiE
MRLNLGCGRKPLEGYLNCDVVDYGTADKLFDFNKFPWDFTDSSVDEIYTSHTLEHLDDLLAVLMEMWRISKPGALWNIKVPYFRSYVAFWDPTHKHFFSLYTFDSWDAEINKNEFRTDMGLPMRWNTLSRKLIFSPKMKMFSWFNYFHHAYEVIFGTLIPAYEVKFVLQIVK